VDTAIAAGGFETLVGALEAAHLTEALRGEGPFTVFAPTDDAFAALPDGMLDAVVSDTELLSSVLLYHVLPGKITSDQISDHLMAKTLEGSSVLFAIMNGLVKINEANIIVTDIEACNGVIHVIDGVLLPTH
jgi:uncharacterized surface protein with fasciclin (FAS1) repeats